MKWLLKAWEGLGYYRRARDLHRSARELAGAHGGQVPDDPEEKSAARDSREKESRDEQTKHHQLAAAIARQEKARRRAT